MFLQKMTSSRLRMMRLVSMTLGLIVGNFGLSLLSKQGPIWFWLPLLLLAALFLWFPQLITKELGYRPVEEQQFTPKQVYSGIGIAHVVAIIYGLYRIVIATDEEWRNYMIIIIILDVCFLLYVTPKVIKIIRKSED